MYFLVISESACFFFGVDKVDAIVFSLNEKVVEDDASHYLERTLVFALRKLFPHRFRKILRFAEYGLEKPFAYCFSHAGEVEAKVFSLNKKIMEGYRFVFLWKSLSLTSYFVFLDPSRHP